jgi:peptide/nickel transport system substrate-binding protein
MRFVTHRKAAVATAALLLLLAACSSGDDDGGDQAQAGGSEDTSGAEASDVEPTHGGTLVYAVEADTSAPWMPDAMLCAAACYSTVGRTVYEPLVIAGTDGQPYPYLLESITPNEDATVFTMVVRDGILFHDGTPLNGDAVAFNLTRNKDSALVGPAVQPIETISSDGAQTVTVTMSSPWPAFPYYLQSQIGLMASPAWAQAVDAGTAQPTEPVGTGPFVFQSYESGENGNFHATRFEDYWRGDGPNSVTGEGLPYLDAVEVRFMPDANARAQALAAGDIDLIATANAVDILDMRDNDDLIVTELDSPYEIETNYLLINNQAQVAGAPNPFADIRVRRALAMATDVATLQATRTGGLFPIANGPFPPGRIGYLEDTGVPAYDVEGASALLDEVEAETGGPVQVALKTTTDPFNLTTAELLKEMWEEAGFVVSIDQIPQAEFIGQALAGNFEVFTWRNHAGVDPDTQFVWWSSTTTTGIALNFGRIIDDEVDGLLNTIRTSTDEAVRQQAAEDLNRRFADQVFNVWTSWGWWAQASQLTVHQAGRLTIPGAPDDVTAVIGGVVTPIEIFEDASG